MPSTVTTVCLVHNSSLIKHKLWLLSIKEALGNFSELNQVESSWYTDNDSNTGKSLHTENIMQCLKTDRFVAQMLSRLGTICIEHIILTKYELYSTEFSDRNSSRPIY